MDGPLAGYGPFWRTGYRRQQCPVTGEFRKSKRIKSACSQDALNDRGAAGQAPNKAVLLQYRIQGRAPCGQIGLLARD